MSEVQTNTKPKSVSSFETFDRMMKLPVVETAWQQSYDVYGKVKKSNALFNWAFSTTEDAIQRTASIAAPFVHKFDGQIQLFDLALVKGIEKLEITAPIVKKTPQQIYEHTKSCVIETIQPHYEMVCALTAAGHDKAITYKDMSVQKVNIVLATKYGSKAVNGIDTTSALAEKIVDYCFPVGNDQNMQLDDTPILAEDNPLLHTIQTVGRLSNKVTRRVYNTVQHHLEIVRKQDVQDYVFGLIAILRLTRYLNLLSQKEDRVVTKC